MTLEDFFTLTEMKDGLTAPSRVEELVTVMQKEKDCVVKNIADATRQWAAVASTIAATENKDCLDRFVQLDGLWFIDRWLRNAQTLGNETSDSFVEESIMALLRALEKLQLDNKRSISSEIFVTVKNLLGHGCLKIQDRARALFDSWNQGGFVEAINHDGEPVQGDDEVKVVARFAEEKTRPESSAAEVPHSSEGVENHQEDAKVEISPSRSSEGPEKAENVQIQVQNNVLDSFLTSDCLDTKGRTPDNLTSLASDFTQDDIPMKETLPGSHAGISTYLKPCSIPISMQGNSEEKPDAVKSNEISEDGMLVHKDSSEEMGVRADPSNTEEPAAASSGPGFATDQEMVKEPGSQKNDDTDEGDFNATAVGSSDVRTLASEPKDELGVTNQSSKEVAGTIRQDGECHSDAFQASSSNESVDNKSEDLETPISRIKNFQIADGDKEHMMDGEDSRKASDFSKPVMGPWISSIIDKGSSDIELEYGIVDALEVARKVAQEVEREVDSREPSCSSSEKTLDGELRQPDSPDSINVKRDLQTEILLKEEPAGQTHSGGERPSIESEKMEAEPENGTHDIESSQVTEAPREPEANAERKLCGFDLNQEVCSDDMDRPVNSISAPISVVSASRPATAPGLPAAPLQFEGSLGWKGSAATSAFRPASPRRMSDFDKKQRQDCLNIDLNVAEDGDDKVTTDLNSGRLVPITSGLHSAESSLDASPRRSERFQLDLNRISDDSDAPRSDLRMDGQISFHRNGRCSPSPASSSSSMQPSMRNFDLNDRPFHLDTLDQVPHHDRSSRDASSYGGAKPDDPVISILGTKVDLSRKDFVPHNSPLPNGKTLEPAAGVSLPRANFLGMGPPVSYAHSSVYGYNGLTTAPMMPFSAMYGPGGSIPYMMDSRGASVVHQMVGSASNVPPPSYSQPPFILSMSGAPPALSGAGSSRPGFDLNSGFPIDGGNRDPVGMRQFFIPGQVRSMEDQLRANFQQPSSSSGIGGKRKEPDSGWEPYPFNYRHQNPPWK